MASVTPGYNHPQHGDARDDESILDDDLIEADDCKLSTVSRIPIPLLTTPISRHRSRRPPQHIGQNPPPRQHPTRRLVERRQSLRQLPHLLDSRRGPPRDPEYHRRDRLADPLPRPAGRVGEVATGPLAQVPHGRYTAAWRWWYWGGGAW